MIPIMLAQLGAGGVAWLLFTAGFLWCGFAWWRVHRCKIALASAMTTLITGTSAVIFIAVMVFFSFQASTAGPSNDPDLIAKLAIAFLILITVGWLTAACLFLVATMRLRQNPEDIISHHPEQFK